MTVTVTQRDIDLGECGSPSSCPLARAIRRQVREGTVVMVYATTLWLNDVSYKSTRKMRNFVEYFDAQFKARPTTFKVPIPAWEIKPTQRKIK